MLLPLTKIVICKKKKKSVEFTFMWLNNLNVVEGRKADSLL